MLEGGGGGDLIKGLCVGASTEELPGGLKVSLLCSPMQRCLAPLIFIAMHFLRVSTLSNQQHGPGSFSPWLFACLISKLWPQKNNTHWATSYE